MKYSFDTSAWLDLWCDHYPPSIFSGLYSNLEVMIAEGQVRSSVEVRIELERQDDDVVKWMKARSGLFVEIDDPIQDVVGSILTRWERLVDGRRNRADPFVIALAKVNGCAVVTKEQSTPRPAALRPRIPEVCAALGVPCLRPIDFIREQGWRF